MRKFIRKIIGQLLILLGFVNREINRVHSENLVTSIYFHNPSKELFAKCINWLISKKYHFISSDDLYDILNNDKQVEKGAVCITVDDGFKDNIENIVPLVCDYDIPITIFIATEPVRNGVFWWSYVKKYCKKINVDVYKNMTNINRMNEINEIKSNIDLPREAMTKGDVIEISKLKTLTIGNHTVNHPITKRCELDELENEITKASKELQSWISDDIKFFAYPNGDFDGREAPVLRKNNIKLAFTTEPKYININEAVNKYQVPRFSVNDDGSFAENKCKMVGVWQKYIN